MIKLTTKIAIAAAALIPATVFAGGNPEELPQQGTCRMVMPGPAPRVQLRPWMCRLPRGFEKAYYNGMVLYTYGDGQYYLPLSELRTVIYLPPP